MRLAEIKFVPAGSDPAMYYSTNYPDEKDTWIATFRRENLPMPDMGWPDGIVDITIRFADDFGNVKSASAARLNPSQEVLPAPAYRPPDVSNQNRVTEFYEVVSLAAHNGPTIYVYGTAGGDWCWVARQPEGAGVITCGIAGPAGEHPHVFSVGGSGRGWTLDRELLPARYGAVTADVASVALTFAGGAVARAATVPFPEATGEPWRAFAVMEPPEAGALVDVVAFDASGRELSRYLLPTVPVGDVPPYVVEPAPPISFAGAGGATVGDFELPPPAFPVNIRLAVQHEGDVTATVACDRGRTPLLEAGAVSPLAANHEQPGVHILLLPPGANECWFEVSGTGTWSFHSP